MSVRSRLVGAFASTAYGYGISVVTQFGTVPILLHAWGVPLYGEWLIISTIPGYLALSDLGLGSALGNDMAISVARGDRRAALAAFQSVNLAMMSVGPILMLLFGLFVSLLHISSVFDLTLITGGQLVALVILLMTQVWVSQQHGVMQAAFRCEGRYVFANSVWQTSRLAEFGALAAAALSGGGLIAVAAAMLAVRLGSLLLLVALLHVWVPWLRFGTGEARLETVKRLLHPGIMFLAFPLASALNLQTPLLIIGAVLGPEATVAFSTVRTISRAIQQLPNVVTNTVWAEVTHAYGGNRMPTLRRLFRLALAAAMWVSLAGCIALAVAGPELYQIWTHRLIVLDPVLLDLLLLVVLFNALWSTASVVFTATNRHAGIASRYLAVNAVAALLCWLVVGAAGLRGIAGVLVLAELVMAVQVLPQALRLVGDRLFDFLRFSVNPAEIIRQFRPGH